MAFFDKVKGFLNIGGVKVKITDFENPYPIGDTVYKGKFEMTSKSDRKILSATAVLYAEYVKKDKDGNSITDKIEIAKETDDGSDEVYGRSFQYPVEIKTGECLKDSFSLLLRTPISEVLEKNKLLNKKGLQIFIEVDLDIEGSPMTPSHFEEVEIKRS